MKTVLFIESTHVRIGGVATRQERLARLLPSRGWRPVFALTWGHRFHDPFAYRRAHPEIESVLLDGRTGTVDGRRLAVRQALMKVNPDVVLPGLVLDAFEEVCAAKRRGRPYRVVFGLVAVSPRILAAARHYAPILDGAFGVSQRTARLLRTVCEVAPERVRVVRTGVPKANVSPLRTRSSPIRLAYVGRLDPEKRPLDIAALARELADRKLNFKLTIVGSGVMEGELRARLSGLIADGRVEMLNEMTPVELYDRIYPSCDVVLVFSSGGEGFPNVLLEGTNHGVIPVTSAFDGIEEEGFLRDGENAMIFPAGDIAKAADRIEQLAHEPVLSSRLSEAARRSGESRSLESMTDEFVTVLEEALQAGEARGSIAPLVDDSRSRLRRYLGPDLAERVRRTLRRRFPHPDTGEWPLIESCNWPELQDVEKLLAENAPKRAAGTL